MQQVSRICTKLGIGYVTEGAENASLWNSH